MWCDIKGFEGKYQVSNLGEVKSLKRLLKTSNGKQWYVRERILKQNDSKGYKKVVLQNKSIKKTIKVHRLVADGFIENPGNKPCVNHKDGDKTNNNITNLEWVTYSENTIHAWKTGLKVKKQGEDHNTSKYSNNEIRAVRNIYDNKEYYEKILNKKLTYKMIGRIFGMDSANVGYIVRRQSWKDISL